MLLQHQVAQVKNKKRSYAYTEKNDIVKAVKRVRNMELKYFNKMSVLGFALTSKVNQLEWTMLREYMHTTLMFCHLHFGEDYRKMYS